MNRSAMARGVRAVLIGLLLLASTLSVYVTSQLLLRQSTQGEIPNARTYAYHIALITQNAGSSLWEEVYESAAEEGRRQNALVERVGESLVEPVSAERAMNMAIYEDVDAILLQSEDSEAMSALIEKAAAHGLPVFTLLRDLPSTKRQAFVGLNDYFLGQAYGMRVRHIAGEDTRRVTVLASDTSSDAQSRKWFEAGLRNALADYGFEIETLLCRSTMGLHDAETVVQTMLTGACPDILICLETIIASSAYQVVRERGMLGSVRIIASDMSDTVLEAIARGEIDSTITVDAQQLGRLAVDAAVCYLTNHLVSYFTEVDTRLMDAYSLHGEEAQP